MIKKLILISASLLTTFSMAKFVAVINDSPINTIENNPDTIIRCASGEGINRNDLITLIDNGSDVTNVCTSNITDFSMLFFIHRGGNTAVIEAFDQDISNWDVSNGIAFNQMFYGAKVFNQDIGNWDVSKGTDFDNMFQDAELFNKNIGLWDFQNGIDFQGMFKNAKSFNQDISKWNVSKGVNFQVMFEDAINFNQDIGNWNVSMADKMWSMFEGAISFNQDIHLWDVENISLYSDFRKDSGLSYKNTPCDVGGDCSIDTDSDGVPDHQEIYNETDPLDPLSK